MIRGDFFIALQANLPTSVRYSAPKRAILEAYKHSKQQQKQQQEQQIEAASFGDDLKEAILFEKDLEQVVLWCDNAFYLPKRPIFTADPLLHAGSYYVQEALLMCVAQALLQTTNLLQLLVVLDLCAAPGGKNTLLASLLSEQSVLVCNKVVRTRANILAENLVKWGLDNTYVCCNALTDFDKLSKLFDVVLVDAPCSGEGMFMKGDTAINEWSLHNVANCATRQQNILPIALHLLKLGSILIYSTCTYA